MSALFRGIRCDVRKARRVVVFAALLGACAVDYGLRIRATGRTHDLRLRAKWLQRWAYWIGRGIGLRSTLRGDPVNDGLLVSNHVSYLDILVLAQHQPMVFVSKAEVRNWPVLGWITSMGGTLYLNRGSRIAAARMAKDLGEVLSRGVPVAFFPEGTSSSGEQVLEFHSSLFSHAAESQVRVVPAGIRYHVHEGSVANEVAYWGDMTFLPHFLNLLGKRRIEAQLSVGAPLVKDPDRKRLARNARSAVVELMTGSRNANCLP
jgi:1-acyl-sn-glycerol-3-phosphate acyltransferase